MQRALLLFLLMYVSAAALAQADELKTYTLEDVLKLGRNKNPSLSVFEADLKAAEGGIAAAGAFPNPVLELELGRGRATRESDLDRQEYRVSLEQPVEMPAKRLYRKRAAEAAHAEVRQDLTDLHLRLGFEVKQAFYRLLLAQNNLETTAAIAASSEDSLSKIRLRVEAGDAPEVDLIKARVELLKTRKELRAAEREIFGFKAVLNRLTGNTLGGNFAVSGNFAGAPENLDPSKLIERALSRHPLVERRKLEIIGAESSLALEQASRMGDLSVKAFYGHEIDKEFYGAGISIPLPLWYGRSGEIASASAKLSGARAALDELKAEIAARVELAAAETQVAMARVYAFEEGLLRDAKETLEIANFSFEQGETSLLELLDTRRTYAAVLLEHNESLYELAVAVARLEQATGGNIHD